MYILFMIFLRQFIDYACPVLLLIAAKFKQAAVLGLMQLSILTVLTLDWPLIRHSMLT